MNSIHLPSSSFLLPFRTAFQVVTLSVALGLSACEDVPSIPGSGGGSAGNTSGAGNGNAGGDGNAGNVGMGGNDPSFNVDSGLIPPPPPEYECGNGVLELGEICDDGETLDGDGCSADCLTQDPDFDCSAEGAPCVDTVVCGNGILEGEEVCDLGATGGTDGCSEGCDAIEEGWECPRPGRPCVPTPVCGNGVREKGEGCDDGQLPADGDGCSADCQAETGYFCQFPGELCVEIACGDGNRTPDEECDDGQEPPANGDGCSSTCTVEDGYRCSTNGCVTVCGDGLLTGAEECDDDNLASGDGCSAACIEEPFYECTGEPSACTNTIMCGNNAVEPGEICDPPGTDGCLPGCKSFSPDISGGAVCNNNVIEAPETCDPPMEGSGCTAGCVAEPGWSCQFPGVCVEIPRCGDGILHATLGEDCDDGNTTNGDGCTNCDPDPEFDCVGLEPSVCTREVCGDGTRTTSEQCDDNNPTNGDGCTGCVIDSGWVCATPGQACFPRCGDGVLRGQEECDDDNTTNGDGCNAGCRLEPGFVCNAGTCTEVVCGNGTDDGSPDGTPEPGESCDLGDTLAGDGCGPTCRLEPSIDRGPNPTVDVYCGDGLIFGDEDCDDGNDTPGDGCSDTCEEEEGFTCLPELDLPPSIDFQVTYRDFKAGNATTAGGHPDFQWGYENHIPGIAGPVCTTANAATCGRLDGDGKPELLIGTNVQADTAIRDASTFGLWYRDSNPAPAVMHNGNAIQVTPFTETLTLTQEAPGSRTYGFNDDTFYPLTGRGYGNVRNEVPLCSGGTDPQTQSNPPDNNCDIYCDNCLDNNYHFTTEFRYFFQYTGGETLVFYGDDDVWVFINGKLAVDIGGLHLQRYGRVLLGDDGAGADDSNCSVNGDDNIGAQPGGPATPLPALGNCYSDDEADDDFDTRFGLEKGMVYEIAFFHAERQTSASNFRLTLTGFLAPHSNCEPDCGDGEVVAGEACDDGPLNANDVSGRCNTDCSGRSYCGDGDTQTGETCDNGLNLTLYRGSGVNECAPGCVAPPFCGDNTLQPSHEDCDNGGGNSNSSYGPTSCTTQCRVGGYCGDGTRQMAHETCDLGAMNGVTYGPDSCGYDCEPGPRCGDNVRNGSEECDGTARCNPDCTLEPYCGDGVPSGEEECDDGQFYSDAYGGCTMACLHGPSCGDEMTNTPFEECDLGTAENTNEYNGCSETCILGPRCGDGTRQASSGESCDNGFNDDIYAFAQNSCGPDCTPVPYCGDSIIQASFELCDDGEDNDDNAYDGCALDCDWGPYCGDGVTNGPETCDDGLDNVSYAADGSGCAYDCAPAPFCGDGVRNGPEQCDEGDDNDGAYGGCNSDCTRAPYCGDRVVQQANGETCDDGPTGSARCSTSCRGRIVQ